MHISGLKKHKLKANLIDQFMVIYIVTGVYIYR